MEEVEVKFEPSGRHGIVPTGIYLIDAALRFGIKIEDECGRKGECDACAVKIIKGAELLSEPTKAELEHLSPERRKKGERLSCQAKIEKMGEITVMTTEKPKPEVPPFEAFKKEFAELPLEEKVKKLIDLEAITLSDTFNFVLNLPYYIGEKIRDGVAEFGFMKEEAEKKAKRPSEHKTEETTEVKAEETEVKAEEKVKKPRATRAKTETPKKPAPRKRTPKTPKNNETSA
ncbi:MAG: 2Fe-2S iron-sulfur cluster-binding protein [Acidobacteriota bacterium]